MSDPFVGELVAEADSNCAAMELAKIWAFHGFAGSMFWNYENSFLQFQANMLDARSWNSDAPVPKRLRGYPAYRVAWKMARHSLSGNYRDYVDSIMREVKCEPSQTLTDLWNTYVAEELTTA